MVKIVPFILCDFYHNKAKAIQRMYLKILYSTCQNQTDGEQISYCQEQGGDGGEMVGQSWKGHRRQGWRWWSSSQVDFHMWYSDIQLNTHMVSMPVFWVYNTLTIYDVTIGRPWEKCVWHLSLLFFATSRTCIIISKWKGFFKVLS